MLKKLIDWLFASAPVEEIPNYPPTLSLSLRCKPEAGNVKTIRVPAESFPNTPPVITDVVEKPQPRPKKPRTTKRAAALVADKSKSQRKPKAKPAKRKPTTKGAKTMAKKKGCKPKGK